MNAAIISAILTSILTNLFTQLQLALDILVHDKRSIGHLHKYGITSTYQEVRRYKISISVESDGNSEGLQSSDRLIQVVSDNFDAHIHSKNELKETRSLATIITQPQSKPLLSRNPIQRLKQKKLKSVKITEVKTKYFTRQNNPPMPESFCKQQVLPLKFLCHQKLSLQKI